MSGKNEDIGLKMDQLAKYLAEAKREGLALTFFFDPVSGDLKVYKRPLSKEPGLQKLMNKDN